MGSILSLTIFTRMLYYMQLVDNIAPLVNSFMQILFDIRWFLTIMLVIMFAFANSFYLIGRNQLEFEGHEAEYADFGGAMKYIYLTALGEFGIEDYDG